MKADFPTERWFWFDPPFHRGQSGAAASQSDNVWRIDFQLGWDADPDEAKKPERDPAHPPRWARIASSIRVGQRYSLPVPAHRQLPPRPRAVRRRCGAPGLAVRGAWRQLGVQDTDNLAWKLTLVMRGLAPGTARQLQRRATRRRGRREPCYELDALDGHHAKEPRCRGTSRNAVLYAVPGAQICSFARGRVNSGAAGGALRT